MADFGDFEDDDAFDTAAPDPEQVARKIIALRRELSADTIEPTWQFVPEHERALTIAVVTRLLDWLRRQGGLR